MRSQLTPSQQRRIDEAESHPAPGNPGLTIRQEKQRCRSLREAFADRYKVHPFGQSDRNFYEMFRAGKRPLVGRRNHLESRFRTWVTSSPLFDHLEVWGWLGSPRIFVGHPYPRSIHDEDLWILDEMKAHGMEIQVNDRTRSHYGFGSVQYLAFSYRFLDLIDARGRDLWPGEGELSSVPYVDPCADVRYEASDLLPLLAMIPRMMRDGRTASEVLYYLRDDLEGTYTALRNVVVGLYVAGRLPPANVLHRQFRSLQNRPAHGFVLTNERGTPFWKLERVATVSADSPLR